MPVGARPPLALLTLLTAIGLLVAVEAFSPSETPEIQLQLGRLLYTEGRFSEARTAFQHALASDEARVRVPARTGVVQSSLRIGDFGTARTEAVLLKQERATDAHALAVFGDAMWSSGLFWEAAGAYRDSVALQSDEPRGHNGMARTLSARGQYDDALEHSMTAVRLDPREADFHHTLGNVYERQGRYDNAATALGSFINLLPKGIADTRAVWAGAELKFLLSFGSKTPYEITTNPDQVYTLPFRVENEKVIVQGRINGSRPLDFVVDTGAELTTMSRFSGERQDVKPIT